MTFTQRAKQYATHIAVGVICLLVGGVGVAAAAPAPQAATLAAVPSTQDCSIVAGATADQWVVSCTITGLVTPGVSPSPSPSSSPSPSPSPSPSASSSPSPTPTGDRTPPSAPTGLVATPRSPTSLLITWAASTDNVGVTDYLFERGTTQLGITVEPDWLDNGLTPNTTYTYRVRARDAAGNLSAYSAVLTTKTPVATSPTPTPTSTPPPSTGNNCQPNPESCGFPGPNNTGATSSTTTLNGNQVFTTTGAKIVNTRINGCVEVRAANVTLQNVYINAPASCFWVLNNFSTGLQVIDSTITGNGGNGTCVGSSGLSLLRVELTGCENGLNVSGTTTVTDSWIHDLTTANGAHTDGAQFNQGASSILFQHNTIAVAAPGGTSAIISWDEGGAQNTNVMIANNLLSGGTYTLYCPRQNTTNYRVVNNRFGTFEFGYANSCIPGHVTEWSGNVKDSNGTVLAGV